MLAWGSDDVWCMVCVVFVYVCLVWCEWVCKQIVVNVYEESEREQQSNRIQHMIATLHKYIERESRLWFSDMIWYATSRASEFVDDMYIAGYALVYCVYEC